jgi:REP element-mobilizing transposase RayT
MKALKQGVARRVLRSSRRQASTQGKLFADRRTERFWQHRFYDFNVFSEKKRVEKLRYMHRNPVKRGLVTRPEEWRWSSYRAYAFGERGLVAVNLPFAIKPVRFSTN